MFARVKLRLTEEASARSTLLAAFFDLPVLDESKRAADR